MESSRNRFGARCSQMPLISLPIEIDYAKQREVTQVPGHPHLNAEPESSSCILTLPCSLLKNDQELQQDARIWTSSPPIYEM